MNYSPKLRKAAEEIQEILEKHDIAGMVLLHTPGHGEYAAKLDPSYSCVRKTDATGQYRIKSNLQEDHNGDAKKQLQVQQDTSNMLRVLSEMGGSISLSVMEMSEEMDKHVQAEHAVGKFRSRKEDEN